MEQATQIFVQGLPLNTNERDLRIKFEKYGDIRSVSLKQGFCFIDYFNEKYAKEAIDNMNGRTFEGSRIVVKQSIDKRNRFKQPGDRKKGPQQEDVCHNCQGVGHWANECREERKIKYSFY
jgi:RNA recognition motif-containing protein